MPLNYKVNQKYILVLDSSAVAQSVEALRYKLDSSRYDSWWYHWDFSLIEPFWPYYNPGVNSASNRNEYLGYLIEGMAAGAYGWHIHVPTVKKFWELKPPGALRACPGL